MTLGEGALLLAAAVVGGGLNSVVGGGSFVAFPALLFAGVSPVAANATTTLALWPGVVASLFAYRGELRQPASLLVALGAASLVGGALGALLLLRTAEATFVRLIPLLLLVASALFTFGPSLSRRLRRGAGDGARLQGRALVVAAVVQLAIAIYGGYFGGGMGILMMAVWAALGMTDVHAMGALRSLLAALLNGVALAAFVASGAIAWRPGLLMVVGATTAGYVGAATARRIEATRLRVIVLAVAWSMTAWFLATTYVVPALRR